MLSRNLLEHVTAVAILAAVTQGCVARPQLAGNAPSEERIAAAQTKVQHETLSKDYEKLAAEARGKAAEHTAMGNRYKHPHAGAPIGKGLMHADAMEKHCKSLVALYTNIADEYDQMAKKHRATAASAE